MTSQSSCRSKGTQARPAAAGTDEGALVELEIRAVQPTTELYLIDSGRRLLLRGLGVLEKRVPPGIYAVKARAGNATHEELLVIRPGDDGRVVTIPELELRSAAPLRGAERATNDHVSNAKLVSQRVEVQKGVGSEIFICARSIDETTHGLTFTRLAVLDSTGTELVDVLAIAMEASSGRSLSFAGCTISLDPGSYRAAYQVGDGPALEQSIVAAEGWQTQVFFLQTAATNATRYAIPEVSILMGREGFEPEEKSSRWAELARQALVARRPRLAAELSQERTDRITDPMTGIYLLHLLVLADVKRPQIEHVLRHVRTLVSDHPDVEVVAKHIGRRTQGGFDAPPLLRHSWELLLAASIKDARLVPAESLSAEIAPRIVAVDPWLTWTANVEHRHLQEELNHALKARRKEPVARQPEPVTTSSTKSSTRAIRSAGVSAGIVSGAVSRHVADTSIGARAVAQRDLASGSIASTPPPQKATAKADPAARTTDEAARLVDTLQLPRATVESLLRDSKRAK